MDSPVRPAPRLIARSILSLGTEVFLAFWTASSRPGLPDMSAPPARAATSMFLISLAKDFARRASITAFLCLVVAHLECPDTGAPSDYVLNPSIIVPRPRLPLDDAVPGRMPERMSGKDSHKGCANACAAQRTASARCTDATALAPSPT